MSRRRARDLRRGHARRYTCGRHLDPHPFRRIAMPKGYWVTCYRSISDPKKLAAYAEMAPKATAPFGCQYIVRGTAATAFEAGQKERIVISVFPSVEKAIAAYNSPAYQEALKALGDGAVRDIRIIEGLD
jgi:uncharacterized protein (DUF1330 family)